MPRQSGTSEPRSLHGTERIINGEARTILDFRHYPMTIARIFIICFMLGIVGSAYSVKAVLASAVGVFVASMPLQPAYIMVTADKVSRKFSLGLNLSVASLLWNLFVAKGLVYPCPFWHLAIKACVPAAAFASGLAVNWGLECTVKAFVFACCYVTASEKVVGETFVALFYDMRHQIESHVPGSKPFVPEAESGK